MSKALMIQGTGSGVGKSIVVAGLCRIFKDMGMNVAPFKSQNMALNSFITKEGGEIGRAQAFQAEAARLEPSTDMNPILLKALGEAGCQVILNGRVHSNMQARQYYEFKKEAWKAVTTAHSRLSEKHDLIVIEGAGSPAEINLSKDEVVNMRVARHTNAPVILIGDIDKGGVFASLYGTIALLGKDADYIRAFIINKFRGDIRILNPGLKMISDKTNRPVIGVVPYFGDLGLHEEDAIPLERMGSRNLSSNDNGARVKIVVLRLRYISNFTDFDPFMYEPDVELIYSLRKEEVENADVVIIPGSKNTVKDLLFLREHGIEKSIRNAVKKGIPLAGICGGYQMLGKKIRDRHCIESRQREVKGMGFLDIETNLEKTKTTCQVSAELVNSSLLLAHGNKNYELSAKSCQLLKGYEIHMGRTTGDVGLFRLNRLSSSNSSSGLILDGSHKGNVWGTYIHGIFDNDGFRRSVINSLLLQKGLRPKKALLDYESSKNAALDDWAKTLKGCLDMKFIMRLING